MSVSYYRKYRPQTVSEIDLITVKTQFERILNSGSFSHAYLFFGPKGTGKTSSARILAKILNCEQNRQNLAGTLQSLVEPCGQCEGCVSVAKGNNLSVIEMDAASNRGIDDIRQLRERVGLAPASGLFTVYVIDEVHMLTTEAFNALLKTLEEPPSQAVFVLCTTELHKVPETVISRCQSIEFAQATEAEIGQSLEKAIKGEGLTVEPKARGMIAHAAMGSFRDGMKLLEQAAQVNPVITAEIADQLVNRGGVYEIEPFIDLMMERDAVGILKLIEARELLGADMYEWGERLIIKVRELLYLAVTKPGESHQFTTQELTSLLQSLPPAVVQTKTAPVPAVPLEVVLIDWCLNSKDKEVGEKEEIKARQPETKLEKQGDLRVEVVKAKWPEVMRQVKPLNHSLEALLRSAQPISVEGDWLTIEVSYTFHKEQLEQERHRRTVEATVSRVMAIPVKIKYKLGKRAAKATSEDKEKVKNVTGEVDDEELAKAAEAIFSN